ncbi:hypothetical protein ScPMuIL_003627 [Solemya velum]
MPPKKKLKAPESQRTLKSMFQQPAAAKYSSDDESAQNLPEKQGCSKLVRSTDNETIHPDNPGNSYTAPKHVIVDDELITEMPAIANTLATQSCDNSSIPPCAINCIHRYRSEAASPVQLVPATPKLIGRQCHQFGGRVRGPPFQQDAVVPDIGWGSAFRSRYIPSTPTMSVVPSTPRIKKRSGHNKKNSNNDQVVPGPLYCSQSKKATKLVTRLSVMPVSPTHNSCFHRKAVESVVVNKAIFKVPYSMVGQKSIRRCRSYKQKVDDADNNLYELQLFSGEEIFA